MEVEQLTALPPSELSCQLTRPAYIFAKHLLYHQRGFPVWSPNPDTYVPGPGDGGYLRHVLLVSIKTLVLSGTVVTTAMPVDLSGYSM